MPRTPQRSPDPGAPTTPGVTSPGAAMNPGAASPAAPAAAPASATKAPASATKGGVAIAAASLAVAGSPSTTVVRKRKPPAKPVERPSKGGLAVGFTAEELKQQAARRAAWMQEEVTERQLLQKAVAEANAKSSNSALRVVLMVRLTNYALAAARC